MRKASPARAFRLMLAASAMFVSTLTPSTLFAADPPSSAADSSAPSAAPARSHSSFFKIKPKKDGATADQSASALLSPDVSVIDAPTAAVLDYGGYSSLSRAYANGGVLQYASFGVFQNLNIGASVSMDGLIGNERNVRVRAPAAQVKWRFYEGDRWLPALAVGYDGQGFDYNPAVSLNYNNQPRGGYVVATQELGVPGLQAHPSIYISNFNTNSIYGSLPFSYNIEDKVALLLEWDNIQNFIDSRLNAGLRVYVTSHFDLDFAVRRIGQGGTYSNGDRRSPERVVQIRYTGNF